MILDQWVCGACGPIADPGETGAAIADQHEAMYAIILGDSGPEDHWCTLVQVEVAR